MRRREGQHLRPALSINHHSFNVSYSKDLLFFDVNTVILSIVRSHFPNFVSRVKLILSLKTISSLRVK